VKFSSESLIDPVISLIFTAFRFSAGNTMLAPRRESRCRSLARVGSISLRPPREFLLCGDLGQQDRCERYG
jgi:hypothetical protein